jgi:hypothetical protein
MTMVRDLEPGSRFVSLGTEYELIHVNTCRAHVKTVRGELVTVGTKTFERPRYVDISPGSPVDSITYEATQPRVAVVVGRSVPEAGLVPGGVPGEACSAMESVSRAFSRLQARQRAEVVAEVRQRVMRTSDALSSSRREQLGLDRGHRSAGDLPLFVMQKTLF